MTFSYQQHIDAIKDLEIKEHWIITGVPGSRTDMITSWLTTCHPGFHDTFHWSIDTHTGGTLMERPSLFDQGSTNPNMDASNRERIDKLKFWIPQLPATSPTATKSVAAKSHIKPWLFIEAIGEEAFLRDFRIIVIDTAFLYDIDLEEKIKWEFIAKTFLSTFQLRSMPLTLENLKQQPQKVQIEDNYRENLDNYDPRIWDRITFVDYERIITEDGASYILEETGLEQDKIAIDHWKKILPSTHTVEELRTDGEVWSYRRITS